MNTHKGRNAREFSPLMHAVVDEFLREASVARLRTDKARALALGMTYITYRRMVKDSHSIDVDELAQIARFMQITPGELITRALARVAAKSQP